MSFRPSFRADRRRPNPAAAPGAFPASSGAERPDPLARDLTLGGAVKKVFAEELEPLTAPWRDHLAEVFDGLLDAKYRGHVRLGVVRRQTLILYVDNSIWLSEFQRGHAATLWRRIQSAVPEAPLANLIPRLDPDSGGREGRE